MSAVLTARQRARRELTAEILAAARRQLAQVGAPALSVRAVARELEMAPSALYRYFATRDDLLTALIVEAYNGGATSVEAAGAPGRGRTPRSRFIAACTALRTWAHQSPHEWALLHGSPVPGYAGDERTTAAGGRVPRALLSVISDSQEQAAPPARPLTGVLRDQAEATSAALHTDLPAEQLVLATRCWTALLGLISSELFGQLRNTFDPADAFAENAIAALADDLGL